MHDMKCLDFKVIIHLPEKRGPIVQQQCFCRTRPSDGVTFFIPCVYKQGHFCLLPYVMLLLQLLPELLSHEIEAGPAADMKTNGQSFTLVTLILLTFLSCTTNFSLATAKHRIASQPFAHESRATPRWKVLF